MRHPITGKMLAGEDVKIGEMVIQTVERESSWAEIAQEETGVKISAGSLAKQVVGEKMPAVTPPVPAMPAPKPAAPPAIPGPQAPRMGTGKGPGGKILVQWASARDLILGDRDGFVTLYLNIGTQESPRYDAGTRLKAGGKEIKVRSPSAPYLVDWNGDGKMDLLVGNGGGYLHFFQNTGSGDFAPGVMVKAAGKDLDVGGNASPCVADWNEDGKKDLVMGKGNGEIYVYLNEGTNEQPAFGKPIQLNGGKLDVGSASALDVVDWDGDGKKDLVVGNSDGEISVFINKGTNSEPQFDNEGAKLPMKLGQDASPQVLTRGYGLNDLVVADRYGEVTYLANTGSATAPNFPEKRILKAGKR